ncbi:MAG: FAD-dependent oxidoreductase, partial [Rhodospirillaceae bacterium]|nr:FAD-dependent oxidoreductase [Rhodospirillaceae bacterium]
CAIATRFAIDTLYGPDGVEVGEDGLKFVEMVTKEGLVDLWDVNVGDIAEWGEDAGPSRFYKANHQSPWVKDVKSVANVPVLGVGRVTSPDDMVAILQSGQADIIGAARPSISDPFLPNKINEGRLEDIRECIGCNMCISRWEIGGPPMICTQNATAMEEYRRGWHPEKFEKTASPCSVLVVGAGPAGMECARVLGERGYDVHLREAEDELGGSIRYIQRYPGLAEWGRVVSYRQGQLDKLSNVEVHTGIGAMSADDVLSYGADRVVVATGSRWAPDGLNGITHAPIDGADATMPQICTPDQVMNGKDVGDRVVVLDADGYFTGVSTAEFLVDQGKQVSLVTQLHAVAPYTDFTLEAPNLHRMIHEKGIRDITAHWVHSIEPGNETKVMIYSLYGDGYQRTAKPRTGELPRKANTNIEELTCDTVVLVTGRLSNQALFTELKGRRSEWAEEEIDNIFHTGDCYAPRMIADAIFDGHRLAREFESDNPQFAQPWIRERQIWGSETYPKLNGA